MAELKNNHYEANDIVSLSAGAAFRQKLGMYLSADKQEAINLGLRELIVNVQDEYEVYKPKNPFLTINIDSKTRVIEVVDNMRGIPVGIREDGINSLTAAFLIPHSGGKHEEGSYASAIGINGEGVKIVCHTAEWLEVQVYRDGKIYSQRFESDEEGARPVTEVLERPDDIVPQATGTRIKYKPDPKVYGDVFIDVPALKNTLKEISLFTIGLSIILKVDGVEEIFKSDNGLIDGLDRTNALSAPFSYFYETDDCKVELALQWVSTKGVIRGYANGLFMPDGGAFISGFKSSLTRTFNSLAKTKYDGETIRDVLDGYVSVKVKTGQFSNQAKTALANPEARTATSTAITNALKEFSVRRAKDFDQVKEMLRRLEKANKAAEKVRREVLNAGKEVEKNQKRKTFASDKLKDAEFLGQNSTLLIVEGDSAANSIAQARDTSKYGILAIRGKMINCLSRPEEDIFKNDEIKLLLSAMNIVPNRYDASKLRYGRIGICVDADADGKHIALLIMSAVYYLAPQFFEEGRLYWLRAPLYIVGNGIKESYYFTDEEFDKAKPKGEITRCKGLGSMSPTQARRSMFTEEFQRLEQIKPTERGLALLTQLMGTDVEPRRKFVFEEIDFSNIRE